MANQVRIEARLTAAHGTVDRGRDEPHIRRPERTARSLKRAGAWARHEARELTDEVPARMAAARRVPHTIPADA